MNVLTLMVDEMSWWALGHMRDGVQTPNIDRLAARGMRFDAAYTPSPICVPARASVATGVYVHQTRNWSSAEPYDGQMRGWAHAVRDAGHDVVSIGKLHYRRQEDDYGFQETLEPIHVLNGQGWVQALLRDQIVPFEGTDDMAREIGPGRTDYHDFDRRVTRAACDWLSRPERRAKPWAAFVSWLAPHFPLVAPPADYALYDAKAFESEAEPVPGHPGVAELEDYFDHDRYFTPETRGIARASYFGLCTFVDRQVGKVLDALDAAGLTENTLILFTSDHGEMLGEKGLWTKSVMYDSSVRVPLIMAGPDVEPVSWNAPVSLIDLAPTICGALGVNGDWPGVDLRTPDADRAVLSEYHDGGCTGGITMLRWDSYKLVYYAGRAPQLFDLAADPEELTDLSISHPILLADGMGRLRALIDPEVINDQCFADQAKRIAALGGADAVRAIPQFGFTPANSR
ncbi:MAG: sulfatase-like hydrolase/transferase [Pseudomonadota bacterium]